MKTFFLFISSFFYFHSASAQVDPSIDWKVLDEEHAVWIYDSRHKNLALQYSKNFKRLYPYLQQMFQEVPDKTTFVISDYTDLPNGSATVFPYPLVTLYPVIPIPSSPIGESDDSFYEILAHEYTHILNLAPVHGLPKMLSWVFGSIVRPNAYLPRWYSEGLAVFTESYFTPKGGRLRSQNFEGLMRAMGREKVWDDYAIDQLNDFQPDWFGGRRAYLLGGALMHDIATQHGLDSIRILNQRYAARIPYFISAPVHEHTGLNYVGLLSETYKNIQARVDDQLRTIQSAPVTKGERLGKQGNFNHLPRFSPDGKYLAYVTRDHNVPSAVHLVTREGSKPIKDTEPTRIAFGTEIEHLAWSNDSKRVAYNNAETFKRYYIYSDIYVYNVDNKKSEKITRGARAGDMTFVNDDKSLVFVQNTPGSKRLAQIDLHNKFVKPIYTPARLGTNLFSLIQKDNKVIFIEQYLEKKTLKAIDVTTFQVQTLNDNISTSHLQKTSEGMILTSSKSGVDNLYLTAELNDASDMGKTRVLTNSETRVFDGDIDPIDKALYYSEQHDNGVFIASQSQAQWRAIKSAPEVKPLLSIPTPQKIDVAEAEENVVAQESDYSAWPYMLPRYWMPFGYVLDGGFGLQASTGSVDPLGKHIYTALAEWDTLTKKPGGVLTYTNNQTPIQLGLDASQVHRYFYSTESVVRDTSFGADANFSVPFMWKSWNAGVGWRHSTTDFGLSEYERSGPSAHLSYNSAVRRGFQISPESGTGFSIFHQAFLEDLGNTGYDKTNLSFRQFIPSFFDRHALMLQVNGTYAPELWNKRAIFYTSSIGGNYASNQLVQPFLVRGYPSGNLLGYNMGTATLEYRFPIANVFRGANTIPFFIRQVHGAVVGDIAGLDGSRYNQSTDTFVKSEFGKDWYSGYGLEVHLECTVGYYLPVTFTFGLYRGDDQRVADEDMSYFFNFQF